MVKVIYREHGQQADLGGKSVAEVRELYKSEFSIPDQTRASLNGKQLKRKLEPETKLGDEDKLSFEERSGKALILLGAFLLTLAITGGLFAYTWLTTSATIVATAVQADFASVSYNASPAPYTFLGKVRGTIGAAYMFDVSKNAGYAGDLEVQVSLANPDKLTQDYTFWMLRLKLTDDSGTLGWDTGNTTQVISLDNPTVSFSCDSVNMTEARYVRVLGGAYRVRGHSLGAFGGEDPVIFCQVLQAGAHPGP